MALQPMKDMLVKAKAEGYAVGHYNINGLSWAQAILETAQEEQAPVILGTSDRIIDFLGGFKTVVGMVNGLLEEMSITVPVALHLDHGRTPDRCKQAIDAGFSSVMIDGSPYPLADNIALTRDVVEYAHARNVSVEAEVGTVGGMEDGLVGGIRYADPGDCLKLVEATKIDALAAALGSVHGRYQGEPKLGFDEMREISKLTEIPLVLHGGSGIPVYQIQKAIRFGHAKINVNTETIQAWTRAIRGILAKDSLVYDPQTILTPGKHAIMESVAQKMREFGTSHHAP